MGECWFPNCFNYGRYVIVMSDEEEIRLCEEHIKDVNFLYDKGILRSGRAYQIIKIPKKEEIVK